jgi:hypothetical protein
MYLILLSGATLLAFPVFAADVVKSKPIERKIYDCVAPIKGEAKVDRVTATVSINHRLDINFPEYSDRHHHTADFVPVKANEVANVVPHVLQGHREGEYFEEKEPSLLEKAGEEHDYTPIFAFVDNELHSHKTVGHMIVLYRKAHTTGHEHEWPRTYSCRERKITK